MTTVPSLARRWRLDGAPAAGAAVAATRLAADLHLPEPLCRLLVARGHADPAAARAFLRPSLDELHDPATLVDVAAAVQRIRDAIDRHETILVHGDYDVDGMCAAALYTQVLRRLGARVVPFVPHRTRDGYDLGPAGVRRAVESDARLILTGDCGTVAHDAVEAAGRAGMDVIVTDHHTPAETLPAAVAVVNPRRADSEYANPHLSGTGVAFKVGLALARTYGVPDPEIHHFLDLVALATVADVMPLTGENRVMTRFGLRVLEQTRSPGLRALVEVAGLRERALTAGHLSHGLGPRLNAIGRLEDAATGLELLLSDGSGAGRLAEALESANARRQSMDRALVAQARERLDGLYDPDRDRSIVLDGGGWHAGVIGIVASRLVELYHRPTILIAVPGDGGLARGSARSIPGFHLLDAVRSCGEHLERFGGHAAAAGFDIRPERIGAFREAFEAECRRRLPDAPVPELRVDLELRLSDVTPELVRYLAHAGPFGAGNPTPVFAFRGIRAADVKAVGAEGLHLKLRLVDGSAALAGIAFRMAASHGPLAASGEPMDVAAQLQEDSWNGRRRLQARVVDLRPAG